MYHYVLLKLKEGCTAAEIRKDYDELFPQLLEQVPELEEVEFLENCIVRDINMDVMIRSKFSDPEGLPKYLKHPLHLAFAARTGGNVVNRVAFDHM